jgi:hypothetical protein
MFILELLPMPDGALELTAYLEDDEQKAPFGSACDGLTYIGMFRKTCAT